MKECARTLDNLHIPPCGHKAMKKGIQIRMFASCQPNQKAAEPCYFVEGVAVEDDGNLVFPKKQASDTQTFCGTDFTKLVCCRDPDEPCLSDEALKKWKWEDAVNGGLVGGVFLIQGMDRGRPVWHYVLLSKKSEELKVEFMEEFKSGAGNIDVTKWGYKIKSGWGEDPSEDVKEKVPTWMDV